MIGRRVIKVGGSCLSSSTLPDDLQKLLLNYADTQNLIIIGGGMCVDAMRDLDSRFQLDQVRMHWRCVELLRTSFEILRELLPGLKPVATLAQLESLLKSSRRAESYLVAVDVFYNSDSSTESRLPVGWETTTDSIAAFLARICDAEELLLLKSCQVETSDLQQLALQGIVDIAFPDAVPPNVQVKIVNLQCGNSLPSPPY